MSLESHPTPHCPMAGDPKAQHSRLSSTMREFRLVKILTTSFNQDAPHDALWIDALCINQQDKRERSQQVQLMGRVYSQARMVLAWLGPAKDAELRNALLELRDNRSDSTRCLNVRVGAWVVQEFPLAKKIQLLYGDVRIDPAFINDVIYVMELRSQFMARMHLDECMGRDSYEDEDTERRRRINVSTLPDHSSLMHSLCIQIGNRSPPSRNSNDPSLMWLLHNNCKRECHEPRDKIYSLLSLAFGNNPASQKYKVDVDYDVHITEVFYSVMNAVSLQNDTVFVWNCPETRLANMRAANPGRDF
ncbi:hypothetical protein BHYA_0091g00140 [Botrytis hyacinthi]|uniref:Heterokaryon incompatibility domain-containing protein n=1 Tax=Botrytis hyacinthi TaxID=278943 RepID=A0A4Z1GQH8_9HELO|nr:hypothetical protein BHYA_0091g00140 [Botrytis hyacinthi]